MGDKEFTNHLARIAEIKRELAPLEAQLRPLNEELEYLKLLVQQHMVQTRSKRTEAVNGFYAVRTERKSYNIEDQMAVSDYLEKHDFDLAEYYTLDAARVKAVAESTIKETGEIIPGVHVGTTEYVSIKEAK